MPDRRPSIEGLPPFEELEHDTKSLIPYAEMLRDLVYRRLYPDGSTQLVTESSDTLFDEALRAVLERMIGDRLAALTPEQFAAAYRSINGDDAFTAALDRLAEVLRRDVERRTRAERMAYEARVSGRVLLGELTPGEVLTIGLFDPDRPDLAARRYRDEQLVRPLHRELQVRLLDPAAGEVEVVRETWTGPIWAERLRSPGAEPLTRGRLGCAPAGDPAAPVAAELTLHAPLTFRPDAGPALSPPQIIGYVETLDRTVLLDG